MKKSQKNIKEEIVTKTDKSLISADVLSRVNLINDYVKILEFYHIKSLTENEIIKNDIKTFCEQKLLSLMNLDTKETFSKEETLILKSIVKKTLTLPVKQLEQPKVESPVVQYLPVSVKVEAPTVQKDPSIAAVEAEYLKSLEQNPDRMTQVAQPVFIPQGVQQNEQEPVVSGEPRRRKPVLHPPTQQVSSDADIRAFASRQADVAQRTKIGQALSLK